jgi:hypothetical protein
VGGKNGGVNPEKRQRRREMKANIHWGQLNMTTSIKKGKQWEFRNFTKSPTMETTKEGGRWWTILVFDSGTGIQNNFFFVR